FCLFFLYRCSEIACSGLEIVGAASLFSIEMNEQIALDDEIVKGLITALASSRRSVSMASCNALLDLFTTSVGRCKLLEFSAIDNLMSKGTVSSFLACLLENLSSGLPINSDELDIISFLKEAREDIGCSLIYQQDIRVVKTLNCIHEIHFFNGFDTPYFLNAHDISRCQEAYNDGYTFALRGMEFRFKDIAAVSEGLSNLFGQPSTGVNMYLTPPNSQGLARHRDDHCVLVCQIRGVKRWKIFPNPCPQLPRLYDNVDYFVDLDCENGDGMIDGYKEFLLREGDILYIPRGFPHEACTIMDDDERNGNAEFSLHLTLAIEIEPPFEWEGFIHVALHLWGHNCKLSNDHSSHDLVDVAVHLMHIAVKLIGDVDPTCRKACLIGAASFSLATDNFLQTSQRSTFNHLLSMINSDSNFDDVFSTLEVAITKNEDLFEIFRWVRHLDPKMTLMVMKDLFQFTVHQKDKVEAAFMEVKSKFCNEVVFDDIVPHYSLLRGKYRSMRKHYINGMLALSCI
ncbi:hypothetical protein R6Q57_006169, partial [Mikania cordata]